MKFKSNRIIAVLLSVITIISAIPITVSAEEADLKISTLSEFQQFAADVNNGNTYEGKTVVLNADIALGGESSPWTPIGNETNRFKGTFNGENHVVSGLFISDSSGKNLGLFGYVENGAVESLTVKGSVYGSGNVAGIVGYLSEGNVINCGNNADVTGSSAVAGVVGYVGGASSVSGCYYIKGTGTDNTAGISETESLSADVLRDAFADGQEYPSLRRESSVCTDKHPPRIYREYRAFSAACRIYKGSCLQHKKTFG